MKIAVFGGSFNPIHVGHLILADSVCTELNYDKILFVPTKIPPHKKIVFSIPDANRLEMLKKAVENDDRFEVEPCEMERGGVSYTWDTICFLEKKYEGLLTDKIGLILGSDLAGDFDKWNNASLLAEKCTLILATRPENKCSPENESMFSNEPVGVYAHEKRVFYEKDFKFPHVNVLNPQVCLSSTEIRQRIYEGKSFRYLVSESVFNYIKEWDLYGKKKD